MYGFLVYFFFALFFIAKEHNEERNKTKTTNQTNEHKTQINYQC